MRRHYMDSMRTMLMLLSVVYHAGLIYYPRQLWRVWDPHGSAFFDYFTYNIYLFHLPAFFLISGFFTSFSLERRTWGSFLANRSQRLLLPFLATLLTFNSIQYCVMTRLYPRAAQDLPRILRILVDAHWRGATLSHLWFISHIFIYALLLAVIYAVERMLRRAPAQGGGRVWNFLCDHGLLIAVMPLAYVLQNWSATYAPAFYRYNFRGLIIAKNTEVYLPLFLFGALLHRSPRLYQSFFKIRWWQLALFALAIVDANTPGRAWRQFPRAYWNVLAYSQGVLTWMACIFVFCLFKKFLDRTSALLAYLSDASFSVYLFHHVFVIVGGKLLLPWQMSGFVKYPIVVTGGFLIPLAIHHFLVLRFRVLRLLFNGTWQKPGGPDRSEPPVAGPLAEEKLAPAGAVS